MRLSWWKVKPNDPSHSYRFHRSSIASVHGVQLVDGRRVVVKAHQPDVSRPRLEAMVDVQRQLARDGFPCPLPLVGPTPLGHGLATVEEELTRGSWHDGHDPAFRSEMARSLAELVDRCRSLDLQSELLPVDRFLDLPRDRLWPQPHAAIFDFDGTVEGAGAIDEVAVAARAVLDAVGLEEGVVVGHTDWRAGNLRFDGERVSAVYDWESLVRSPEPILVGGVAHAFCSDWSEPPSRTQAPSIEEARTFVSDYEAARGGVFEGAQRRLLGAGYAYATAYTARCGHAIDPEGTTEPREGFRTLIHDHGITLVDALLDE